MESIKIFLKKEAIEILQSKRLIIALLIACIYCPILNVIGTLPGSEPLFAMDMNKGMLSINLLVAALCSDIIYVTMIEEVCYGTFDIMYLSKCSANKIILLKCFLPTVLSSVIICISVLLNNIIGIIMPQMIIFDMQDLLYWIMVFLTSAGCSFFEFFRCINGKKETPTKNDYLPFIICGIYGILYYNAYNIGYGFVCFFAICITSLMYILALWRLKRRSYGRRNATRKGLLRICDGSYIKAIISREAKKLLSRKMVVFRIIYLLIVYIILMCTLPSGMIKEIALLAIMYALSITFAVDMYFESVKLEISEKMDEILLLVGINRVKNYIIILAVVGVLAMLTGVVGWGLCSNVQIMNRMVFDGYRFVLYYVIAFIVCGGVSYVFSLKALNSLKDIRIVRRDIYIVSLIVYTFFCFSILL